MLKKLISSALAISLASALVVMPAHAAGFSSENKVVDIGGVQKKVDSNFPVQESHEYSTNRFDYLYVKRNSGSSLSANKKIVRLNEEYGNGSEDFPSATYVHSRFYLAINSGKTDDTRTLISVNTDTGSNDGRLADAFCLNYYDKRIYSCNSVTSDNGMASATIAEVFKMGKNNYNQMDLIVDVNGTCPGMVYLFCNGEVAGYTKIPKLDYNSTKGLYHGYTIYAQSGKWASSNHSMQFKIGDDGVRSTIYKNGNGYFVTLEDVLNDQGLADDISGNSDDTIIMKTSDLRRYMPGEEDWAFTSSKYWDITEEYKEYTYNQNVTYSDGVATIAQNTDSVEVAAKMLRGLYPEESVGVGHNGEQRAKLIKISFDQQMNKGKAYYKLGRNTSGLTNALSFWTGDDHQLVMGCQGGSTYGTANVVLDDIDFNDKCHIDWVLENGGNKMYIYINGKYVATGQPYMPRFNNISILTEGDASLSIENWSMTLYNEDKSLNSLLATLENSNVYLNDIGYEIVDDQLAVYLEGKSTEEFADEGTTYVYTALYDESGKLLGVNKIEYIDGRRVADEDETNVIDISEFADSLKKAKVFIWSDLNPQIKVQSISIK